MIRKQDVLDVLSEYDKRSITVGVLGSHSALDVCDAPATRGSPTWLSAKKDGTGFTLTISRAAR